MGLPIAVSVDAAADACTHAVPATLVDADTATS